MQKQNFIIEFIQKEGWKRIVVYLSVLFFAIKSVLNFADSFLYKHYSEKVEVKYLQEMIQYETELQELQEQLEAKAAVQKTDVIKATGKYVDAKQRQNQTAQNIQNYEKNGFILSKSVDSTISDIDNLRAKLQRERNKRLKKGG